MRALLTCLHPSIYLYLWSGIDVSQLSLCISGSANKKVMTIAPTNKGSWQNHLRCIYNASLVFQIFKVPLYDIAITLHIHQQSLAPAAPGLPPKD